ncbi:putative lrr receptor-like serine/threonine-protein kinase [Quercus suber]|uniref:Lrr receptor-like serine/threonine-protein kinase n=1 Tax=Quercus suber TaxID=58331 RepID=A0AAW0IRV1_QUESU
MESNRQGLVGAADMRDLQWLGLSDNHLGRSLDFLTSLTNCSKLYILDFSINQFGGVLPIPIGNLSTQLTKLYFGGNEISGTIPVILGNLVNLIVLSVEDNLFTGLIPTIFERFQKIQLLSLNGNRLLGEIPTSIGNLTQLFLLDLHKNRLEGSIPPSVDEKTQGIVNHSQVDANVYKCLFSVLEIGLACSLESPKERMNMEQAISFSDFFVADILTSMAKVFSDLERSVCRMVHQQVYFWVMGSNLVLRWAWTYKLSAHLRHNYLTVFAVAALEIFRRFQWNALLPILNSNSCHYNQNVTSPPPESLTTLHSSMIYGRHLTLLTEVSACGIRH